MLTKEQALQTAQVLEPRASDQGARETTQGWFFPLTGCEVGCNGVVINKRTRKMMRLGSAFPVDRDLELYDRGYQFERYDLVITSVARMEPTVETLRQLGIAVVEPRYEHGSVWRVPRELTRDELMARVAKLPCVFGDIGLYFVAEHLELAREAADFSFVLLEYRPPKL